MKIAVVSGENPQTKYICVGEEKIVEATDFSDLDEMKHHLEWETDITLENSLGLIKKLFDEARHYQCSPEDRCENGSPYRIITLGRTPVPDQLRLYPQEQFWEHGNPLSQVQQEDFCVGLLTPHYALHLLNSPPMMEKTTRQEEAVLSDENTMLKFVRTGTLHEGIHNAQVSAYSNVSGTIAEIIAKTSPAFAAREESAKAMLTHHLDQILAQYPKPVKVN